MDGNAQETDAIVIGAGPVGLFAVFELGMVRLRCHVVDALEAIGGQLVALYPTKPIYDIPGYPKILAGALVDQLAAQAAPFRPHYHLGVTVTKLAREGDGRWCATLTNGGAIVAPCVIIAAGAGAFGPNRPPLDNLAAYEGNSVFYLVKRQEDFAGKRVVIAGGGNSAADWAIALSDVAARVMVVHRRAKFRCAPDSEAKMHALAAAGKIEMVIPYQLKALAGAEGKLSAVIVADLEGGEKRLDADVLLPFFGLAGDLGPIAQWGLRARRLRRHGRSLDLRHQSAGRVRHRRRRRVSGQAQADPAGLRRGGGRGPRSPRSGPSGPGPAFRIFDHDGRAGCLTGQGAVPRRQAAANRPAPIKSDPPVRLTMRCTYGWRIVRRAAEAVSA